MTAGFEGAEGSQAILAVVKGLGLDLGFGFILLTKSFEFIGGVMECCLNRLLCFCRRFCVLQSAWV